MKKVLFMTDSLGSGGAERVLIRILNHLSPDKFKITVFLLFKQGVYLEQLPSHVDLKYLCLGNDFLEKMPLVPRLIYRLYRKALLELNRLLSGRLIYGFFLRDRYHTEVAFIEGDSCLFVANSSNRQSRKIAWIHSDLRMRRTLSKNRERRALHQMDRIICVSRDAKRSVLDLYPELCDKTCVIYNPVDPREILNKSLPLPPLKEGINILCIGRLERVKGFELAIKAHKALIDEGICHNLYIVGEGSQRKVLTQLIHRLNVKDTVVMTGFVNNPYPFIRACDILLITSYYEGLPLVLIEGLMLGKPIIATRCSGPSEVLDDVYGLLAEVGDIESLKNAMKRMLCDESLRKYYAGQSKIRKQIFCEENTLDRIAQLL